MIEEKDIEKKGTLLWNDLDLELISRIKRLELKSSWNFIVQSMVSNFLYSVRKAVEDGIKDKEKVDGAL